MEVSVVRNELDDFKCNANHCIHMKLIRTNEDIDQKGNDFLPDMTHQLFGDSETIFGFKDLDIKLYYTSVTLMPYLNISYGKVCSREEHGVPPDDLEKLILEGLELPPEYTTSIDTFRKALREETFHPFGQMIDSYTIQKSEGDERQFEVYYTKIEEPGFREFHSRLQTFIMMFIDAASYIDADDEGWDYFLLLEKYKADGNTRYAVAGYMTVYNFYAYPSRVRPRMSQVLVLPPFQKMGLCGRLVQSFYNFCYCRSEILDITVEDPSENFQRVRDFVDASNCQKLSSFEPTLLHQGFSHDMLHEAQSKLKLSRLQTRRIYEILRLKATDENDKEMFRKYRLDVKKRINLPFLKNKMTHQKLKRSLDPDELSQALGNMKTEQKYQYLEKAFQDDVDVYRHIIRRLENRF